MTLWPSLLELSQIPVRIQFKPHKFTSRFSRSWWRIMVLIVIQTNKKPTSTSSVHSHFHQIVTGTYLMKWLSFSGKFIAWNRMLYCKCKRQFQSYRTQWIKLDHITSSLILPIFASRMGSSTRLDSNLRHVYVHSLSLLMGIFRCHNSCQH